MSYLFYFDPVGKMVLRPECLKQCPELTVLNDKEVAFVILYADYHSKFSQFPEQDRIRNAMWEAFDDNMPGLMEKPKIKAAIDAYTSLQYNDKIELIKRYRIKLDRLSQRFLSADDDDVSATTQNNTMKTIDSLRAAIRELDNEVTEQMISEGVLKGDQHLSYLEVMLANQKRYKAVTAKK
jgi:hypothetical protein